MMRRVVFDADRENSAVIQIGQTCKDIRDCMKQVLEDLVSDIERVTQPIKMQQLANKEIGEARNGPDHSGGDERCANSRQVLMDERDFPEDRRILVLRVQISQDVLVDSFSVFGRHSERVEQFADIQADTQGEGDGSEVAQDHLSGFASDEFCALLNGEFLYLLLGIVSQRLLADLESNLLQVDREGRLELGPELRLHSMDLERKRVWLDLD